MIGINQPFYRQRNRASPNLIVRRQEETAT
jgi:hypothetical protein